MVSEPPLDVAGIGFGPSNIALAVYAREVAGAGGAGHTGPPLRCMFFEQAPEVRWHPGMLIDGARMQISFLKDLVTLRNPASPYSFLQYLRARGRLERFVNLGQTHPTRIEYNDYLGWVAADFADQVRYRTAVRRVVPVADGGNGRRRLFRLELQDTLTRERSVVHARNVVHAGGGRPRIPPGVRVAPPVVVHSSEFLQHYPDAFPDRERPYTFLVAGAGQSAGEIVDHLLERYENAQVHLVVSGYALRPTDNSPFVNEQFYGGRVDGFYASSDERRAVLARELHNTNYGVVREDLLDRLYDTAYIDEVKGRPRLRVEASSRLAAVVPADGPGASGTRRTATIVDRHGGGERTVACDGVVLATGYHRTLDLEMFADVLPVLATGADGRPELTRRYRARAKPDLEAGLYLQGYEEARFGLGDTLLSLLPFRSRDIVDDIRSRLGHDEPAEPAARLVSASYPPRPYLERDVGKLRALMEQFKFATVITAAGPDEPCATQVPLILDPSRGRNGVLFGHMDRTNPQARMLDGRPVLVLFNGPNAYMSPKVYANGPLPTWNSMTVHVRGRIEALADEARVVEGLCEIARRSEPDSELTAGDPRIPPLIDGIVGFEIEVDDMVGRFKLSQEHDEPGRRSAARELATCTGQETLDLVEHVLDLPPEPIGACPFFAARPSAVGLTGITGMTGTRGSR